MSAPWHRRIFKNTLINGASMVFAIVVAFFLTPFLIDHLGASGYGLWSLIGAFSISAGYLSLADLGVQQTTVKLVAEHEARDEWDEVGHIARTTLWLFTGLGLALGAAMALFTVYAVERAFNIPPDLQDDVRTAFLLFSAQVPLELCALPFAGVLEGRQRYGVLRATELIRSSLWIAAVVIFLSRGGGLVALAVINLAGAFFGLALTWFAATRSLPPGTFARGRASRATFRRIFSFSVNLFVMRVTGVLYRQMDRVIILAALTSVLLAKYEVASKLQMLAALALAFTASAVMPAASNLAATHEGRSTLRTMFLEGTKYALVIVVPITVALMVWADDLVVTWVGQEFSASSGYARWFLVWVIPAATTSIGLTMMVGMGYVRQVMYLGLASAIVNLALSVALVRPLGVLGVIVGTLVGYGLVWYPYMRLFLRTLGLTWPEFGRRTVWPVLIVCVPWTIVVALVHTRLHATSLAGALGAVGASVLLAWIPMFWLSLARPERRVLLANARSILG